MGALPTICFLENERLTEYTYDIEDPGTYGSDNNRLMYYTVTDVSDPENPDLLSTTWYYYDDQGNPTRIITEDESLQGQYTATRFKYDAARQVVAVLGETWTDQHTCQKLDYELVYVREFRYDGDPRARPVEGRTRKHPPTPRWFAFV